MKKFYSTIALITLALYSYAQSIDLYYNGTKVNGTTITVPIQPNDMKEHDVDIHNVSSSGINFLVQRILSTPWDSTCSVYFCTGINCYAPSNVTVFNEPTSGNPLAAGASVTGANGLIAHFDVGPTCCETYVKYKVYNTLKPNDTTEVTFYYKCVTGINENKVGGSVSAAYPNPANDFVSIKYSVNDFSEKGKIVLYDMLGKAVKEINLQDKLGVAKINVSELTAGIYFYTFVVDEKAIATRKLVISER